MYAIKEFDKKGGVYIYTKQQWHVVSISIVFSIKEIDKESSLEFI